MTPISFRSTLCLGVLVLFHITLKAQDLKSKLPVYESPLELPVRLSATFGELRANHFHAGIDLKTQQKTGFPVMSISRGYVSRIGVSPSGYGKAIYITHPEGYTSVYGHLERFSPAIDSIVEARQYSQRSFAVNLQFSPGDIPVSARQLIGYSGNTGSSGGPHVHFEIRDNANQDALNPLEFGIAARDFIRPKIELLTVYPGDATSTINGFNKPFKPALAGWGPSYRLKNADTIKVAGTLQLGVACHDLLNYEPNKNGVQSIEFMADSIPFFSLKMQRIPFADTRYIHAITDYDEYRKSGKWVVWSKKLPGNKLPFGFWRNNGKVEVKPGQTVSIQVNVSDLAGNVSVLRFTVKGTNLATPSLVNQIDSIGNSWPVQWDQALTVTYNNLRFESEPETFYDNFTLLLDTLRKVPGSFSQVYKLHQITTPLHKPATLSIKPEGYATLISNKLLIARVNNSGKLSAVGGKLKNGVVSVPIREFGRFAVVADTTAPTIKPLNFKTNYKIDTLAYLRIAVDDDLSGIAEITPTLNGKWLLMEYDAKNNLLFCPLKKFVKGENRLTITITDQKGNSNTREYLLKI